MLSDWLQKHTPRLVTPQCHLCKLDKSPHDDHPRWCNDCLNLFEPVPRCQRCGLKTLTTVEQCGQCLSKPPPWHRLYCVGDYTFPIARYIQQMKYSDKFWFTRDLSKLLASRIDHPAPLITSVPLHWTRYIQRSFNQSQLLANYTAQELGVKSDVLFRRTRATLSQQGLTKSIRLSNLNGAFTLVPRDFEATDYPHIAIIDDVVTTGSTVYQLCQLLLEVGVKRIDIYCICRTPEPSG
ncbi:ComF family protein [Vibrio bathopelagicus]|uniref:ComF family protein n=1 Tax=Vibrio bathopelagicus TaxID=2777577 RepID=UPI0018653D60|nr:ComF family protein [Vibrio bathopelagicus]